MSTNTINVDAYDHLIAQLAACGRKTVAFDSDPTEGLLLRLDVDFDLGWAAETAEINARHGLRATYFVFSGSGLYNPAAPEGQRALARIGDAGQYIGLHFWAESPRLDAERMEREFEVLRTLVPEARRIVAWHNPTGELGDLNAAADSQGFVATYAARFGGPDRYISDSNLRNSPDAIAAFAEDDKRPLVQILLHPFNWVVGGRDMAEIIRRTFVKKTEQLIAEFEGNRVWKDGAGDRVVELFRAESPKWTLQTDD